MSRMRPAAESSTPIDERHWVTERRVERGAERRSGFLCRAFTGFTLSD